MCPVTVDSGAGSTHRTTRSGDEARVQATRIRPDTGATDRRRLAAATLSAVLPGLGQAFNRRRRLALLFLIPSLIFLAIGLLLVQLQSPIRIAAWVITPSVLGTVLTLNLLLLVWRLVASFQAFLDTRWTGPTGRLGIVGMVVIAIVIVVPHFMVFQYGRLLGETFGTIFQGQVLASQGSPARPVRPAPADGQRINVLIIGVDTTSKRTATLTDTMMVASLDPVGGSVSMVSLPRDLINVPARQRRRVRSQAQLAHVVRRPPRGPVPERRAVGAAGCGRRAARHPDPLLRDDGHEGLHRHGRCRRRRGRHRQAGLRGPEVRRLRHGPARLQHHAPASTI